MDYELEIKKLQTEHSCTWIWIGHLLNNSKRSKNESIRRDIKKTLLIQDNVTCKYRKEGQVIKQYIHVE